jgi:hypothetical protein
MVKLGLVLLIYHLVQVISITRSLGNDLSTLPRLEDTESIEIYHLKSISQMAIQSMIGSFSVSLSGVALRGLSSNNIIILYYTPRNFSTCFLPSFSVSSEKTSLNPKDSKLRLTRTKRKLKEDGYTSLLLNLPFRHSSPSNSLASLSAVDEQHMNSTISSLLWDKTGEIMYSDEIDTNFWSQSTFLGRMNGVVYKKYMIWLDEEFLRFNAIVQPQAICSSEYELMNNCYTHSITWDTFVTKR